MWDIKKIHVEPNWWHVLWTCNILCPFLTHKIFKTKIAWWPDFELKKMLCISYSLSSYVASFYQFWRNEDEISRLFKSQSVAYYTPRFNEVERGVYWHHLVRLSVCGQNRVRSVSSTILIGSISYLHILSSNFRRCVACNARFKIQKFVNFDFVFFWLGIQYDSMVWVTMRRRGVSSERRRSSCFSYHTALYCIW